jgi:hypothetical protein
VDEAVRVTAEIWRSLTDLADLADGD